MKRKTLKLSAAGLLMALLFVVMASPAIVAAESPEIFVQLGHSSNIKSVSYTSDGAYLVSGSEDKTVKIWEAKTGRELRTLRHNEPLTA
ncbi:MAG TPA: hypothetical protein PKZ12_07745, partial [Smithellaceae bacterium]|nr:hypothetical protein [Smithellaceae bacterium]